MTAANADDEAGDRLFRGHWIFLKSVPSLEFLPEADRPEVAFAGRSNVGMPSSTSTASRVPRTRPAARNP